MFSARSRLSRLTVLVVCTVVVALASSGLGWSDEPSPPEEPAVQFRDAGVPPLLVGTFYRHELQIGDVFSYGWQGPLHVVPGFLVPARNFQQADTINDKAGLPELPANMTPSDPQKLRELDIQFGEVRAYFDALVKAHNYSAKDFAGSGSKPIRRDLLMQKPRTYRGSVVHLEGTLERLLSFDAPLQLQGNGITTVYMGLVTEPDSPELWFIVFTELPPGLKPAKKLKQPIEFDGYFFKVYGYENNEGQKKAAPLLVGNSPILTGPSGIDTEQFSAMQEWSSILIYGIVAVIVLVVVLAGGLTFWFRRGDARVRQRLDQAAHQQFVDPSEVPGPDDEPNMFPPPAGGPN